MFNNLNFVQKILFILMLAIIFLILSGTIAAFVTKKADFASGMRRADPSLQRVAKKNPSGDTLFLEIGKLRLLTADSTPISVVLSPYFSYSSTDADAAAELEQKKQMMSGVIFNYFSLHTKEELMALGELKVKEQLAEQINRNLVLGKVKKIYFEQYLFID